MSKKQAMPLKNSPEKCSELQRIVTSTDPVIILLKYLLIFLLVLAGIKGLWMAVQSLILPDTYRKDFLQEYLMAKAVKEGLNPYLSIKELADFFLGAIPVNIFNHPSAHPPPVAVMSLPLAMLTYQQAATAWLFFELLCVIISIYFILEWWLHKRPTFLCMVLVTLVVLAWPPFWEGLITGQFMTLLLMLMVLTWRALLAGYQAIAGLLLGFSLALKFMGWPILLFLLLCKKWRASTATGCTIILIYTLTALTIGLEPIIYYFQEVGSNVESLYRTAAPNFSIWSVGWRLFSGTETLALNTIEAPPFFEVQSLAPFISLLLLLLILTLGFILANQSKQVDSSFAILICVSVLASPVTWSHYLVLLLLPMAVVSKYLLINRMPTGQSLFFVLICFLFLIPRQFLFEFIEHFNISPPEVDQIIVPFSASLLTLLPLATTISLMFLAKYSVKIEGHKEKQY
jgi:hypothetical protein